MSVYYRGASESADQTEEGFPYLEFTKRPDRHRLTYDGREASTDCGVVWFNRTQVAGREDFRFYMENSWVISIMGKCGSHHGMAFEPGDVLLLPPKVELEGSYGAGREMNVSLFQETLRSLTTQSLPRSPSILRKGDVQPIVRRINRYVETGEGDPVQLCLSMLPDKPERLVTPARRRLAKDVRDLLDAGLEEVSIGNLCRRLGVSVRGAEIAFRAEFSESMREYVTRNRLERAHGLISDGWSVSRAANEVGWGHLGRFSAAFKKVFGMAPSCLSRNRQIVCQ